MLLTGDRDSVDGSTLGRRSMASTSTFDSTGKRRWKKGRDTSTLMVGREEGRGEEGGERRGGRKEDQLAPGHNYYLTWSTGSKQVQVAQIHADTVSTWNSNPMLASTLLRTDSPSP